MAFIQKGKAENREQLKASGEPGEAGSNRPKVVVHHEEGGGFHLHWGEDAKKTDSDEYLNGLLSNIEEKRASEEGETEGAEAHGAEDPKVNPAS